MGLQSQRWSERAHLRFLSWCYWFNYTHYPSLFAEKYRIGVAIRFLQILKVLSFHLLCVVYRRIFCILLIKCPWLGILIFTYDCMCCLLAYVQLVLQRFMLGLSNDLQTYLQVLQFPHPAAKIDMGNFRQSPQILETLIPHFIQFLY